MNIIDRYIIREILHTLLAVIPIVLLIFVGHRLADYLGDIVSGQFSQEVLLPLLALKSLSILEILLPLVFYLSVLLALGRLYRDSEMVVLAACGVSPARVIKAVLLSALLLVTLVALVALYLGPWAMTRSNAIIERAATAPEISIVTAGRFKESRAGEQVFYVEDIAPDQTSLRNIFVQGREADRITVLSAQTARRYVDSATGDQRIVLENGKRYEWTPGQADHTIIEYERYALTLPRSAVAAKPVESRAMATAALLNSVNTAEKAELQWRLSMPIAAVLLALLAVALSYTTPRHGRYAKLLIAIAGYLIYHNMLAIAQTWVEHGRTPAWLGMWWVHILLLLIIIILYLAQFGARSLVRYPWAARPTGEAKP